MRGENDEIKTSKALDADDADLKTRIDADKTKRREDPDTIGFGSIQSVQIRVFHPRSKIRVIRVP